MPAILQNVLVFSIEEGEGKNGYWAIVTLLNMTSKKKLELFINDNNIVKKFLEYSGKEVDVVIEIIQNKFGTRLGKVLSIEV